MDPEYSRGPSIRISTTRQAGPTRSNMICYGGTPTWTAQSTLLNQPPCAKYPKQQELTKRDSRQSSKQRLHDTCCGKQTKYIICSGTALVNHARRPRTCQHYQPCCHHHLN
eukprot:746403-Pyramimonas_sp.AAC.1